jgi:hypothetical protein
MVRRNEVAQARRLRKRTMTSWEVQRNRPRVALAHRLNRRDRRPPLDLPPLPALLRLVSLDRKASPELENDGRDREETDRCESSNTAGVIEFRIQINRQLAIRPCYGWILCELFSLGASLVSLICF